MNSNDRVKSKLLKMAFNGDLLGIKEKVESDKGYYAIPNNWEWKKIGDIVNIINGFTPLRTETSFWDKPEINWFTIEDMRIQGHFINKTEQFITKKALGNSSNRLLPPNTILLCCTASVGEVAFTNIPLTTNQQFNGLIVKDNYKNDINPLYIFEYAKTLKDILIEKAGKTTINFVSTKKLSDIYIPIPSYDEQNMIVNKLESVFELIDKKEKNDQKKNKLKETLKEKIIDIAIHGKLVENNSELSQLKLEPIKDNSTFNIPNNWVWTYLKDISDYGKNKKKNGKDIKDNEWILELEDIEKDTGRILKKVYQKERKAVSDKNIFKENDVLYGKLRPYLNKCVIAHESGYCSTEIEPITLIEYVLPEYLHIVMTSKYFLNYVNSCSYGAKMPRLGTKDGQNAKIPLPPLEEQKKIVEKIESLFELIEQL